MSEWIEKKERGSLWTMRVMLFLCRHMSPAVVRPILYPIVVYFFLTSSETKASSLRFYAKVKGESDWRDYFRQLVLYNKETWSHEYEWYVRMGWITE